MQISNKAYLILMPFKLCKSIYIPYTNIIAKPRDGKNKNRSPIVDPIVILSVKFENMENDIK